MPCPYPICVRATMSMIRSCLIERHPEANLPHEEQFRACQHTCKRRILRGFAVSSPKNLFPPLVGNSWSF